MEWTNASKYNSFNSYKGLTYFKHYQKIVGWLDGRNALPAPLEASLDPISACNSRCYYCNSQRYLRNEPVRSTRWGRDYMEDLLIDLSQRGVKAFCWGGGGEATLNPRLAEMTRFGVSLGMECSIITNGVNLSDDLIDALLLCRWIGVSLDSADPKIYQSVRGTDDCRKVLTNIGKLAKQRTKTDICVKCLVLPETIDSLCYTCGMARDLGVQDFHVRPVDLERKDNPNPTRLKLDMAKVQEVFARCHDLETDTFHIYTVQHKYDPEFHVKHDFKKCLASPLVMQMCTDKKMYVCVDHRLEPRFEIKEWGSTQHRELLKGIDPEKECARCTWSEYNRQIAECVVEDRLCRVFP